MVVVSLYCRCCYILIKMVVVSFPLVPKDANALVGKKKELLAEKDDGKKRHLKDAMRDKLLKIDSGLMDTFGQLLSPYVVLKLRIQNLVQYIVYLNFEFVSFANYPYKGSRIKFLMPLVYMKKAQNF